MTQHVATERREFEAMLREALERSHAMSPEDQASMHASQRIGYVLSESIMAIHEGDAPRTSEHMAYLRQHLTNVIQSLQDRQLASKDVLVHWPHMCVLNEKDRLSLLERVRTMERSIAEL